MLGDDDARELMERLQRRFAPPVEPAPVARLPLSLYLAQAEALAL
jgi:hypothetical protein